MKNQNALITLQGENKFRVDFPGDRMLFWEGTRESLDKALATCKVVESGRTSEKGKKYCSFAEGFDASKIEFATMKDMGF